MVADDLLRRTADELEIRNLICRLAMLADDGDPEEYASLFTDDARWEMRPKPGTPAGFPPIHGRANILAGVRQRRIDGVQGPGSNTRHAVLMTTVDLNGDAATARSYFSFYKNTHATAEVAVFGTYHDEFRRDAEGWKLSVRSIDPA